MNKIYKKIIPILIIAMFFCIIPKTEYATETLKIGDITGDGIIDSRDTLRILEHIAASAITKIQQKHPDWILTGEKLKCADINQDGIIDSRDTLRELEYIAATTIPAIAQKHPDWKKYIQSKWIIEVTGISLDKTSITMDVGKVNKLVATINPANATNKVVTWSSSDTKVATVDALGNIEGKNEGITIITAKSSNGKMATCKVEVKSSIIAVTGILLDKTALSLTKGDTANLVATINPTNATNTNITWSSSNDNIVSVSNGNITAKNEGTATITATSSNGKTATCKIEVKNSEVSVTSISLNNTTLSLTKGDTATLVATINPTNATNKNITWSSSNDNIVSVSNGNITAKNEGTATITATSSNGKTATCSISVKLPEVKPVEVSSVTLRETDCTIAVDTNLQLNATILPANASNKTLQWSSSDNSVAQVNNNGVVKGIKPGQITVKVTTSNNKTATCIIRVNIPAKSISLNYTNLSLNKGSSQNLIVNFNPTNTTAKTITWKSSNNNIATVNDKGVVTAKSKGTATITATSKYGKSATCNVTITDKVLYVSKNGSDSNAGTSSNAPLKTISKGLSKVSAGYTLLINSGTYYENGLTLSKKGTSSAPIKIISNGNVVIDGSEKKRILKINNSENIIIEGITFQNLNADDAKGILIEPSAKNIVIRNCKFNNIKTKHPKSEDDGASAIFINGESSTAIDGITIKNCSLTNIGAGYSEAISVDGNCTNISIVGVSVTYTNGLKGNIGICICGNYGTCSNKSLDRPRNVTISNCYVSNCKSPYDPGSAYGIYVDGGANVTISNNTVENCEGGIEIGAEEKNSKLTYETENIRVQNNTIKNCGIGAQIGGWDGKAIVYNVLFDNNTLLNCGHNGGKAIEFSKCKKVTISNCKFDTNKNKWYEGSSMAKDVTKKNNTSI
ncbi:MAG: Ig-like domain-containing protein [Clostridia bacterium]|nr:Ig-like domain-containing protein [Clostridia bacterium]